jgi:uncharacterized phiE125 gp8 family phage protein
MFQIIDSPPAVYPISLEEAKAHLRVLSADENSYISSLIPAATRYCEQYQGRVYAQRDIIFINDKFVSPWRLPLAPVSAIKTLSVGDATLGETDFSIDGLGRVRIFSNVCPGEEVKITATCGYADIADTPTPVKQAILLLVGHLYSNREAVDDQKMAVLPFGVKELLDLEKVY